MGNVDRIQAQADFISAAPAETIQRVAGKVTGRNIEALVVEDGDEARTVVLARLPNGADVHSGKSKTLQDAGILDAIHDPNEYDALRPRMMKMTRQTPNA